MLTSSQTAEFRKNNAALHVHEVHEPLFSTFGKILAEQGSIAGYQELRIAVLTACAELPEHTAYTPFIQETENLETVRYMKETVFGGLGIQTGCCWGMNQSLNGMEYHKSSEVLIALTDMALFLGKQQDITCEGWDTSQAMLFLVPEGTALELFQTTLHFAPISVCSDPFYAVIMLPKGTNLPLDRGITQDGTASDNESRYLFMKNKWLLTHQDSPAAKRGACIGITGNNLHVTHL